MNEKVLIVLILIIYAAVFAQDIGKIYVSLNKEKFNAGELQTFEFDYITEVQVKKKSVILINASPAEVWDVIADWDSMSGYVPGF